MVLRDSSIYIVSKAVPSALGFGTVLLLTWLLTPEAYGTYTLDMSLIALAASVLFDWQTSSFVRWYQERSADPRFVPTAVAMLLATCVVSTVCLAAAALVGIPYARDPSAWVLLVGSWCYDWFEFMAYTQVLRFRPGRYLAMNLTRGVLILLASAAAAYLTGSPVAVVFASVIAMLSAGSLYALDGLLQLRRDFDPTLPGAFFRFGVPMGLTTAFSGLAGFLNRALLVWLAGSASAGFFAVGASAIQAPVGIIATGIGAATLSRSLQAVKLGDARHLQRHLAYSAGTLIALLAPASVGLTIMVPRLVPYLVNPAYREPVIQMAPWLAAAGLLMGVRANYMDYAFQFSHRTPLLVQVSAVYTMVNVALDMALIPFWGATGAAAALAFATGLSLLHSTWLARRVFRMPIPVAEIVRVAVAVAVMSVGLGLMPPHPSLVGALAEIMAGATLFGITAFALDILAVRKTLLEMLTLRYQRS